MNTVQYLDAVKAKQSLPSDYALAAKLGVTRQSISGWRSGRSSPDPLFAVRIAEELQISPLIVIADIETEKARRGHHENIEQGWKQVIERLSGAAACLLLGTVLTSPPPASASMTAPQNNAPPVYIMSTRRRRKPFSFDTKNNWLSPLFGVSKSAAI